MHRHVHYESDLLLNLGVIVALALDVWAGLHGADALFGIAHRRLPCLGSGDLGRAAIDMLMDREWPDDKRQRLLAVVARHPRVDGVHDLRTRRAASPTSSSSTSGSIPT